VFFMIGRIQARLARAQGEKRKNWPRPGEAQKIQHSVSKSWILVASQYDIGTGRLQL